MTGADEVERGEGKPAGDIWELGLKGSRGRLSSEAPDWQLGEQSVKADIQVKWGDRKNENQNHFIEVKHINVPSCNNILKGQSLFFKYVMADWSFT